MSFYNTEDFTLDEIAWFNFYHKAIQKKKKDKRCSDYNMLDYYCNLNPHNEIQENLLKQKLSLVHREEIYNLVKKYRFKDLDKSPTDKIKYEITNMEIIKYEKFESMITHANKYISKKSLNVILEGSFNFSVWFIIRCNLSLNMYDIQSELLEQTYTKLNHCDVLSLNGIVLNICGENHTSIKCLKYNELINEVLNASLSSKSQIDKIIEEEQSILNNLDVILLPKNRKLSVRPKSKPEFYGSSIEEFNPKTKTVKAKSKKKYKRKISEDKNDSDDDDDEEDKDADDVTTEDKMKAAIKSSSSVAAIVHVDVTKKDDAETKVVIKSSSSVAAIIPVDVTKKDDAETKVVIQPSSSVAAIVHVDAEKIIKSSSSVAAIIPVDVTMLETEKELLRSEIINYFNAQTLADFKYIGNVEECIRRSFADSKDYSEMSISKLNITSRHEEHQIEYSQETTKEFRIDQSIEDDYIWNAFSSLFDSEWLSGNGTICLYCEMLNDRELALWKIDPSRPKSYFIDSTMLLKLNDTSENSYENVFRNLNIFNFDQIFMCINIYNQHWAMYRIRTKNKQIECFDSILPSFSTSQHHNLNFVKISNWLVYEQLYHDKERLCKSEASVEWKASIRTDNLKQDDGYNCGIHMLMAGYFFADFESIDSYNQDIISNSRLKIAVDIFKGFIEDPRISDVNDYHFCYKSFQYHQLRDDQKLKYQCPKNKDALLSTRVKVINFLSSPYAIDNDEMMKETTEEDEEELFLPAQIKVIEKYDSTCDILSISNIQKAKKRKICHISQYESMKEENVYLKKSFKAVNTLVTEVLEKHTYIVEQEQVIAKKQTIILEREQAIAEREKALEIREREFACRK
jgi:hypothetical protein